MELFYTKNIEGDLCVLDEDESRHCVKVLRHRKGDNIDAIDGLGTLLHGLIIDDNPRAVRLQITERTSDWGGHPYRLDLAVCPPKNADRYDWFVEKATEIGIDTIIPVIGDHSERRVLKTERLRKLATSAAKQSLKAYIPKICEPMTVREFIKKTSSVNAGSDPETPTAAQVTAPTKAHEASPEVSEGNPLKLFAFCFEVEAHQKISIREALASISEDCGETTKKSPSGNDHIIIMIGPEGDFSSEEAELAMAHGFTPIHLGTSRLRTETAAILSAISVYSAFI